MNKIENYKKLAQIIRASAVKMTNCRSSGHVGGSLSMADLVAVLYEKILHVDPKNPDWTERDCFILSKGHAAAGYMLPLLRRDLSQKNGLILITAMMANWA